MSALLSFGKQTSLPGITDFQFVVDMVEDAAFFQAPERCDQQIARTVPGQAVERGLRDFRLPGRRFEYKGEYNGARIYDDYAHHPGELAALLDTAATLGYRRIICAFQPHTYSRTHELFDDFVKVLRQPDVTLLAEIYAARETNTLGISSRDLAEQIPGSVYCPTLDDVTAALRRLAQPGDLILTVGAGDIYTAGEQLLHGTH